MLDILKEPQGETYLALLRFAASHCDRFSLVWRNQLKFDQSAQQVAVDLEPWLISEANTKSWPGTQGPRSLVRHYRVVSQSVKILQIADGLYFWLAPALPEDLAFYSSAGVPWLGTVSHENMAWFQDGTLSADEVRRSVPRIAIRATARKPFP